MTMNAPKRKIDYRREQEATLARPHLRYTAMARTLFNAMDLAYGRATTLPKVRLLETLARIPYQAWETRQYSLLSHRYHKLEDVQRAKEILEWGREAQDNEFWHLLVIEERMRLEGVKEGWLWEDVAPHVACFKYAWFSRALARLDIRRAFYMNAEFEDHAEHVYFQFVKDHPELETQKVESEIVQQHPNGPFETWADVFRQIALDERDHMNNSFKHCGMSDRIVPYLPVE